MWEDAVQQERMDAGQLPSLLCLAGKLQAAQIPVHILTRGLELTWHHKCPLLAHSCVFKSAHDGKACFDSPRGTLHSILLWSCRPSAHMGTCQLGAPHGSGRGGFLLRFRHISGPWETGWRLHHGHSGWPWVGYWGHWLLLLCADIYSSTKQMLPAAESHRQCFTPMQMMRSSATWQRGETPTPLGLQHLLSKMAS